MLVTNGWYHVTARGNERRAIFRNRRDYERFLEYLEEMGQRYGVLVAAYVLMRNHYHLVLQTPRANLSEAMKWLNVSYSVWFNRRYERAGHLFQGRFTAVLIDGEGSWLGQVTDYVHLNPVRTEALGLGKEERAAERAGLRPPANPEEIRKRLERLRSYQWSSYPAYAGYVPAPDWLAREEIYRRTPGRVRDGARRYREHLEGRVAEEISESPWHHLKAGLVLGSETFWRRLEGRGDREEMTALRHLQRRTTWEEVVRAVEEVKGESWSKFRNRHGDWGRDLALYLARRRSDMTLVELGRRAGNMKYHAVAQAIRGFEKKLERPEVRSALVEAVKRLDQFSNF